MKNIDANYKYFKKEFENFKKKYPNEYLVISEKTVLFHNLQINEAVEFAKNLEAGTYIIQKCEMDEDKIIQTFHSRVAFDK